MKEKLIMFFKNNKQWLRPAIIFLLILLYLTGVLCTGIDQRFDGFSLYPWDVLRVLFSGVGLDMLILEVAFAAIVAILISIRKLKYMGMTHDERDFWYADKGTYGTAAFMDEERMKTYFDCKPLELAHQAEGDIIGIKDGIVLSRPKNSRHNKNTAAYGSSGAMKSRAIIRNKIIGCARRGESMLITDPKSELFKDTAVWLRKKGYIVRTLNLVSLNRSSGWNFMEDALAEADGDELEIVDQMANVIIANTGGGEGGKDDFWNKAECGLLKAIMLYQYYTWKIGKGPLSFSWAYQFLLNNDIPALKSAFEVLERDYRRLNAATNQFNIFLKSGDNVCKNVHFGLLSRLNIFNTPSVCDLTGRNEISLERPAKEKCVYFVITSDQDNTYNFVACLFFALFFIRVVKYADTKTKEGRCNVPVNLLLDEFPNIGEIPDFEKKIATVRSRDVSITILFQSLPQLKERYPDDRHYGILSNCDLTVFLGTTDPVTAEAISARSGEASILVQTQAEEHNKFSLTQFTPSNRESQGIGKRMILTPDEVLTMAKDDPLAEIIIMRDQPILMATKFDYTRDPAYLEWEPITMEEYDPYDSFWFDEGIKSSDISVASEAAPANSEATPNNLEQAPSPPLPEVFYETSENELAAQPCATPQAFEDDVLSFAEPDLIESERKGGDSLPSTPSKRSQSAKYYMGKGIRDIQI